MGGQADVRFPMDFFGVEELGRAIKRVRALRGLTQHELAMRTNTSTKFISNVENGKDTAQLGKVLLLNPEHEKARELKEVIESRQSELQAY